MIDPALLSRAAARLGIEPGDLTAGDTAERSRSCVTPLRLDTRVVAWHKQILAGGGAPGEADVATAARQLARAEACTRAAVTALAGDPDLTLAPVLAVDLESLTFISGHVEGVPLGTPVPRRGRGPRALATELRRVGRAIALIESANEVVDDPGAASADQRISYPLDLLRAAPDRLPATLTLAGLTERVEAALAAIDAAGRPTVYAHGDVSPTNVLVSRQGIGLIDAEWPCRMAGFDLATLSVRLELSAARLPLVGGWATGRLKEGYRTVSPIGPGFDFERTQRCLRLAATGLLRSGPAAAVAAAQLRGVHRDR